MNANKFLGVKRLFNREIRPVNATTKPEQEEGILQMSDMIVTTFAYRSLSLPQPYTEELVN